MQFKIKFLKSLSHHLLYVLGVIGILDHAKKVVRVSHQMTNAPDLRLDLLLKPQVQHIVQEYIGKYRAKITALRCPLGGQDKFIHFNEAGLKKPSDKQKEARILDANLQTPDHPIMRDCIEKTLNVCLYNIMDGAFHHRLVHPIQRLMTTASGSIPI
jgi:hypothetical protein